MTRTPATREHRTRGRTRAGRLRLLDALLIDREADLLGAPGPAPVVDLGVGALPWTTMEWAHALWARWPGLSVTAVEIDPLRLAVARDVGDARIHWVEGGFDLPAPPARLVRAMNVLRQYRPDEVTPALSRMGAGLAVGGLLVEGSASRGGEVVVARLIRQTPGGLQAEGLLFATDFSQGFAPALFAGSLPRDLRPDGPLHPTARALLDAWTRAWEGHRHKSPPAAFSGAAASLAGEGWRVEVHGGVAIIDPSGPGAS